MSNCKHGIPLHPDYRCIECELVLAKESLKDARDCICRQIKAIDKSIEGLKQAREERR